MDEPTITLEEADKLIEEAKKDYDRDCLEEGQRFKLITQHYAQYKLAKLLGISRSYIRQRLEIYNNLIPEGKELLKEGKIKFTQALNVSRAETVELQRSTLEQVLKDIELEKGIQEDKEEVKIKVEEDE